MKALVRLTARLFGYDLSEPEMAKWAGFSANLLAVLIGSVLAVGSLVAYAATARTMRLLDAALKRRAASLAQFAARAAYVPMALEDREGLARLLQAYRDIPDLAYIRILGPEGLVVAEVLGARSETAGVIEKEHPVSLRRYPDRPPLGVVRAGLSRRQSVRESRRIVRRNALMSLVLTGAAGLAGFLLIRGMTLRFRAIVGVAGLAEALRRSNEDLSQFAHAVSHDLRAPLRHIDGYLALLRRRAGAALDETSLRHLDSAAGSARRMNALIDDLLLFSRMGLADIRASRVPLGELAREVVRDFELETRGRRVEWEIGELPEAECDRSMIRLVFQNYIGNALKFTRDRDPAVIRVGASAGPPGQAVVFVRDNGIGFDMRYKDKLFNVFQRLETSGGFEGTGVGLANVRRIVRRHGGEAWGHGEPGKGATFYFSLPLFRGEGELYPA